MIPGDLTKTAFSRLRFGVRATLELGLALLVGAAVTRCGGNEVVSSDASAGGPADGSASDGGPVGMESAGPMDTGPIMEAAHLEGGTPESGMDTGTETGLSAESAGSLDASPGG